MATANPIHVPDRSRAVLGLAIGAALVTILLTGVAFWLSYEALHDLATGHHLTGARAWAWPATLDSFIIVGELLVLRASLLRRVDLFATVLVASGSAGSIVLNVVSVGAGVDAITQVVAAIPPTAALLAFTALMRQIYRALAGHTVPEPQDPARATLDRVEPADAPLTAVTAPVAPPMPELPPIVYSDPRAAAIRPLYNGGYRPGTRTMLAAIAAASLPAPSEGLLRGSIRAEVEQHEPHLAELPAEPRTLRTA